MLGKSMISICSWFSLSLPPRRNWAAADSGAASSQRNGKGVTFPECLRRAAASDGIATGTSYLLSRLGRTITAVCCKELEPADMCWMCSEQAAQPGPWVSSCMETCLSSKFQRWAQGEERHGAAQRGVVLGMRKAECPVSWDADNLKIGLQSFCD